MDDAAAPGTYLVQVEDMFVPTRKELEGKRFKNISSLFRDETRWRYHASCGWQCDVPGVREFAIGHFDRVMEGEEAIALAAESGFRPSCLVEGLAFDKAHHEVLQRYRRLVLLGSFALSIGRRYAPCLTEPHSGPRGLLHELYDIEWPRDTRFLLVRI